MPVGTDKVRVLVTLTKEDKEKLEKLAKNDNRNLSNYINTVLKKHMIELESKKVLKKNLFTRD
ncbi:toxin-antitoxin system protein [Clostridium tertium]|uniref:toxin-antitoxin system protein n=1 Tax=Clostridium tertium TaxID=1559 RepID=UPI003562CE9B